ncbi:MAG: hypothetical protein ACAH59_09390, partial [Pseudobdellovibrionaceae bacterium]
ASEFKTLMNRKINKKISFNPQPGQDTFTVSLSNGKTYQIPTRNIKLTEGHLTYSASEPSYSQQHDQK